MGRWRSLVVACGSMVVCGALAVEPPRFEVVLDATLSEAWASFSTEDGLRAWMAPRVELDFRVGGTIRANYNAEAGEDDPGWIETSILAYEPERMFAFRTSKSPAGFPHARVIESAWSVVRLEAISPWRTRVVLTTCGWGEGGEYDAALAYFKGGNEYVLERLREVHADAPRGDAMALLRRLVGGTWEHESQMLGQTLHVRNTIEEGAGGSAIVMRAERLMDGAMRPYTSSIAWLDASTGGPRYASIKNDGSVASGAIRATGASTLEWDWRVVDSAGTIHPYLVRMELREDNVYAMTLSLRQEDGSLVEMGPAIEFRRSAKTDSP